MKLKIKVSCPTTGRIRAFEGYLFYAPNHCEICHRPIGKFDNGMCNCKIIIEIVREKLLDEEIKKIIEELLEGGKNYGCR